MMKTLTLAAAAALGALAGLSGTGPATFPALAHGYAHGALQLEHPWMRPPRAGQGVTAAYVHIVNDGEADRLIAASTPKAEAVELHTHIEDEGVMRMRRVEAIAAPAGGTATLQPGGDHIMLFGLDEDVRAGAVVPVTLIFERAGPITVEFHVEDTPSEGPWTGGDHHH